MNLPYFLNSDSVSENVYFPPAIDMLHDAVMQKYNELKALMRDLNSINLGKSYDHKEKLEELLKAIDSLTHSIHPNHVSYETFNAEKFETDFASINEKIKGIHNLFETNEKLKSYVEKIHDEDSIVGRLRKDMANYPGAFLSAIADNTKPKDDAKLAADSAKASESPKPNEPDSQKPAGSAKEPNGTKPNENAKTARGVESWERYAGAKILFVGAMRYRAADMKDTLSRRSLYGYLVEHEGIKNQAKEIMESAIETVKDELIAKVEKMEVVDQRSMNAVHYQIGRHVDEIIPSLYSFVEDYGKNNKVEVKRAAGIVKSIAESLNELHGHIQTFHVFEEPAANNIRVKPKL